MAILKTKTHRNSSSAYLEKYLNKPKNGRERVLSIEGNGNVIHLENWGEEFDDLRKYWGKNSGITLRHFIVSPDPKVKPTLKQVKDLAYWWADKHFGEQGQWVIVCHDDNGIIHAHVALNWVRMDGYKWHFDRDEYAAIANNLHQMSREMGIPCTLEEVGKKHSQKAELEKEQSQKEETPEETIKNWKVYSDEEERIKGRKGVSWKEYIRRAVEDIAPISKNFEEFQRNLYRKRGIQVRVNARGGLTYIHPNHQGDDNHNYMCKDYKLGKGYTAEMIESMLYTEAMKFLYENGKLEEGAFDLRINKATKKLEYCRPKVLLPKPKTSYDKICRTSRRTGLANIKSISKAITSIHMIAIDEGVGENINYKELVEKLETRVKNLEAATAKIEVENDLAGKILANIRRYNRTLDVYEEFKSKGSLTRNRFQKEHSQEIADHESAAEWLEKNNIHDGNGKVNEDPASKTRVQLGIDLDKTREELKEATERLTALKKSGVELYKRQNRPMLRIPHDGGMSSKQEKPIPNRLGLNLSESFRQESTVCHGKRNRDAALKRTTVTVKVTASVKATKLTIPKNKQDLHAMQKSLEEQKNTRIVCALGHERAIDKRIRQEDEDMKKNKEPLKPLEEQNRMINYGKDPRKWKERGYYEKEKKIEQKQEHTIANIGASAKQRAAAQGQAPGQTNKDTQKSHGLTKRIDRR